MAREIRIHIDTLEYTRNGLRTRSAIPLQTGQHSKIVLLRPDRLAPPLASYAGFPRGSSFPGPAILALMQKIDDGGGGAGVYQLFAHTSARGSEAAAKTLTDQRGIAVHALLVGDVDEGIEAFDTGQWDELCTQVMLRALRCDPGPIDGDVGDATVTAVRQFQQRYIDDVFHAGARSTAPRRFETLNDEGDLDRDTREALVEAYLLAHSPDVDVDGFHATAPIAGCGSFNPVVESPDSALNDRVSLVRYPGAPSNPESAPCSVGDPGPCAVVDHAQQRCMWFREHVRDPDPARAEHKHFSPMWRRLPDGDYALSVLTTVPDDEEVVFEVVTGAEALNGPAADASGITAVLSESLPSHPHRGVASVTWTPPTTFLPNAQGRVRLEEGGQESTPAFRVSHPGSASGRAAKLYAPYPRRAAASTIPAGVFGFDSSFPRPGIWASLTGFPELLAAQPAGVVAFGHTDAVGSDAYNKQLSDRRARAVSGLIRSNLNEIRGIAQEEDWGLDTYQAMLRAVGCDPGPPDGDAGEMTTAALRAFQEGYPRGLFISPDHPRAGDPPKTTGSLDSPTKAAILEAYVHHLGLGLENLPSVGRTFAGCGEFNRQSEDAAENRRVTLAIFQDVPDEAFPCADGDEKKCTLDGSTGLRRCSFYREQVDEPEEPSVIAEFFEDHWMPTPSLRAYMSVLTSLPDDTPVTFKVFRSGPTKPPGSLSSYYDDALPEDLEELLELPGRVLHGVAFATWEGDDDFHPFDTATWFHAASVSAIPDDFAEQCRSPDFLQQQIDLLRGGQRYRPPLFLVEGGGAWFLSRPPGRRVRSLEVREDRDAPDQARRLAVRPDGTVFTLDASDDPQRHDDTVTLVSVGPARTRQEVEQ